MLAVISEQLAGAAAALRERREPFVTATVVRVTRPTSVSAGASALIRADGTLDGFIGGVCAQHSVRLYALKAIASGEPLLLRIVPDPDQEHPASAPIDAGQELSREDGAVTVRNPCISGGAVEVFLEPSLPAPRLLAVGDSPIVPALVQIGPVAGFDVVTSAGRRDPLVPAAADFGVVVAAHGRDELEILRAGVLLELPYVALVASRRRGRTVLDELRQGGIARELADRVETPAGLEIGAQTPGAIAVSILARAIQVRSAARAATATAAGQDAPHTALDPICGMEVVVMAGTPQAQRDGETFYFCCDGCQRTFMAAQVA